MSDDYPIPASAIEAARGGYEAGFTRDINKRLEKALRAAFDELGMAPAYTWKDDSKLARQEPTHYRYESRWMPVENSQASCSCGESTAWHNERGLQEKP